MLSKNELEEIIKAWPDEDGNSSNPQVFDKWIFNQNQYFVDKVYNSHQQFQQNTLYWGHI